MSGSARRNPFILVPIVLDALVALMLPSLFRQWGLERTVIIAVASMGAPWLLYYIVGRVLEHVAGRDEAGGHESEQNGFV